MTRLVDVSTILVACLLIFLDLLLLLCSFRCIEAGPRFLVTIPAPLRSLSNAILPCRLDSAASAATLMSLVLMGGISTLGGGGARSSPFCSRSKKKR